ncbi:MAG: elongation factor P [Candidatus Yanofskybacteria bacterium]|nr:elongation factor P [Candidatus Yanofskybacteria bacterium]
MSLGVNDLKPKTYFIYEDQPYMVLETHHLKMQQRRPVVQTRMRNLLNGKVLERNLAQSDFFEEADVQRKSVKFLYNHRDQYWFADPNDPSNRFELPQETIGDQVRFMKPNTVLEALSWDDKVINISLPIKMQFTVTEAPPGIKGDTATGGTKQVVLDTGATINAPLFVNEGDVIVVNTETGEYVERAK